MKTVFKYITIFVILCVGGLVTKYFIFQLYPLTYYDIVCENAEKYDVDPYLIMALIKAESNFDIQAMSRKEAKGVMQLTDSTAQWCAEQMGITDYNGDLFNYELNIKIGTWYFADYLMGQFDGDIALSVVAYNAGIGNVQKWLKNNDYSKDGINLDKIPFKETDNYVKRIERNYKIYKQLYKNKEDY